MIAIPLKDTASAEIASREGNLYDRKSTLTDVKINTSGKTITPGSSQ